jgi:hypothetical protein
MLMAQQRNGSRALLLAMHAADEFRRTIFLMGRHSFASLPQRCEVLGEIAPPLTWDH